MEAPQGSLEKAAAGSGARLPIHPVPGGDCGM